MPITYYKIQIQVFKTPYLHFSVIEDLEGGGYDRDLSLLPVLEVNNMGCRKTPPSPVPLHMQNCLFCCNNQAKAYLRSL